MDRKALNKAIEEKYICPTRRPATERVGLEFELPVVNLQRAPVDFAVVHGLTGAFISRFGFGDTSLDDEGNIYNAANAETGDALSFDCSYNTLEISFGAEEDLNAVYERFRTYYTFIQDYLTPRGHTLTGMGVNPRREYNLFEPIPNGRYRMLLHHLRSYKKYSGEMDFHDIPSFGLFSCASQVQLDAQEDTVVRVLNTFSRLEPLKALLFANSLYGEYLCARDMFWRRSLHGFNPRNVDAYESPLGSVSELVDYIRSMSIYCLERDGKYINFRPTPLEEFFSQRTVTGECFDGSAYREIEFSPEPGDLAYLRSFKFEDLTFRGTVEFRSVCQQPVREIMGPSAFHAGLMKNLDALQELLDHDTAVYGHGAGTNELRRLYTRGELLPGQDAGEISALLIRVLDLASDGLKKRGRGEERFLVPLYARARELKSPAKEMKNGLAEGRTLEYYIHDFAKLE